MWERVLRSARAVADRRTTHEHTFGTDARQLAASSPVIVFAELGSVRKRDRLDRLRKAHVEDDATVFSAADAACTVERRRQQVCRVCLRCRSSATFWGRKQKGAEQSRGRLSLGHVDCSQPRYFVLVVQRMPHPSACKFVTIISAVGASDRHWQQQGVRMVQSK